MGNPVMGCGSSSTAAPATASASAVPEGTDEPKMDTMDGIQEPILAISTRDCVGGAEKVPELVANFQKWSDTASAKSHDGKNQVPGFKTMYCCQDPNNKDRVIDLQWFNSINAFRGHMDMKNMTLMMETMACEKYWNKKEGHIYAGYALGGFEQQAMMGMTIPEMFSWKMFPMPMKAEARQYAAGFMNSKAASSSKPPLIILQEVLVKSESLQDYIKQFQAAADEAKQDAKVITFYSTQQCLHLPLTDPNKTRTPDKFVNLLTFEDIDTFDKFYPKVAGLSGMVVAGPSGMIWGDTDEEKAKAKEVIGPCVGDMTKSHIYLGVNEMVVAPALGSGTAGHSDHTFNCQKTDPVPQAACEDCIKEHGTCSVM